MQVSDYRSSPGTETERHPDYAHADHHALAWPAPSCLYDLNDGGMALSENEGYSWVERNFGLVTSMFYDIDVAQSDPNAKTMGGGTQDNGTLVTKDGPNSFEQVARSDGGLMAFDPVDPNRFLSTLVDGVVYLHEGEWRTDITPGEGRAIQERVFTPQLVLHPGRTDTVYLGTTRLWRCRPTTAQEYYWDVLSHVFDDSVISAIEVIPYRPATFFVGTQHGGLCRSRDDGHSWSGNLATRQLPGAMVTKIRGDTSGLMVAFALRGHRHLFSSDSAGDSWAASDNGLPDMPFRALALDPDNSDRVFAACDQGVYRSEDFGQNWTEITGDLPPTLVTDLIVHKEGRYLFAATYGRGIWRAKL